jgi:TetR/AcrR family transcriptional regulator
MMPRTMNTEQAPHNRMSAANRQHQLLEVAMNAFSRRGFKGTTTKEIAAAAGITEAVIFQHFPSKEALYSAVLDLHLDTGDEAKWIEEISGLMERNDDEGIFLSFASRILHSYRRDPMLQRVILFAALEGHEQGMARLQKQFAPILELFMAYVTRRQREGALINCDPQAIMVGLGGVAHQYGLLTQIFRAPTLDVDDEEMAKLFTRMFLHGIEAPSPQKPENSRKQKSEKPSTRKAK